MILTMVCAKRTNDQNRSWFFSNDPLWSRTLLCTYAIGVDGEPVSLYAIKFNTLRLWLHMCRSFNYWYFTVYPKKYAHGFCFAVLCCSYTLTGFAISIRLTSLALWQSNDCPSASKATLMNMDKYFMWIHYERLHNHKKAKHNKTVCIFLGIYCMCMHKSQGWHQQKQWSLLQETIVNWGP